jgi:hypothetical protein
MERVDQSGGIADGKEWNRLEQAIRPTGKSGDAGFTPGGRGAFLGGAGIKLCCTPVDSFALYQSAPLASREENTAWIKNDQNVWLAFDGSDVGDYPASFWMDVLASQVQYMDTSVTQPIGKNKMSLFPNPVSTKLHIRLGENGPAGIELFSLTGKLVKKEVVYVDQNLATIDLSDLRRGLYLLKLTTGAPGCSFKTCWLIRSCLNLFLKYFSG